MARSHCCIYNMYQKAINYTEQKRKITLTIFSYISDNTCFMKISFDIKLNSTLKDFKNAKN